MAVLLIGGVACAFESHDDEVAGAVLDTLGEVERVDLPAARTITVAAAGPDLPAREPDEVHGAVTVWRDEGVLHLQWETMLSARADEHALVVGRRGAADTRLARSVRQLMPYSLGHLLAGPARAVAHAGAFVLDQGAVVVLGTTGAGKSTLVYAAQRAGRRVLADDLVVIEGRDDDLGVTGIPRPLALATEHAEGLPPGERLVGDVRDRWQFPLGGAGGTHLVAALVVVEHSPAGDGHLVRVTASDAWDLVVQSHLAGPDPTRLRASFPAFGALARRPAWRLGHGSDPTTRLDVAARLLDRLGDELSAGT